MTSDKDIPSQVTSIPSKLPPATGNLFYDSIQSAQNIFELPCSRNALLAGIASGAGMGFIRGITAGPMMAGNWAFATFTIISLGSWHICQKQFSDERKKLSQVYETAMPKRTLNRPNSDSHSSSSPSS